MASASFLASGVDHCRVAEAELDCWRTPEQETRGLQAAVLRRTHRTIDLETVILQS